MKINIIEGKWVGHLKYDQGYPLELQAKYVSFEMNIFLDGININGTWIDEHTIHHHLDPSTFEGTFVDDIIHFTKTRSHDIVFDPVKKKLGITNEAGIPVLYSGRLRKKIFSAQYYFKGKCCFTLNYTDKAGNAKSHDFKGLWSMKRNG